MMPKDTKTPGEGDKTTPPARNLDIRTKRSIQGISGTKSDSTPEKTAVHEGISPEFYEKLRSRTPSAEIQARVNTVPKADKIDPVYGYRVDAFEADHIVPVKKICQMPKFDQLATEKQAEVLNYPRNFMGLGRETNASKGAKSYKEWDGHSGMGPVPPEFRKKMIQLENSLEKELQQQIEALQGER